MQEVVEGRNRFFQQNSLCLFLCPGVNSLGMGRAAMQSICKIGAMGQSSAPGGGWGGGRRKDLVGEQREGAGGGAEGVS